MSTPKRAPHESPASVRRKVGGPHGDVDERAQDKHTFHAFDDTRRYIEAAPMLTAQDRLKIFEGNVRRVYPRLDAALRSRHSAASAATTTPI